MTKKIRDEINTVNCKNNLDNNKYFPLVKFKNSLKNIPYKLYKNDLYLKCLNLCYNFKLQISNLDRKLLNYNKDSIRVVAISDTHTMHNNLELPEGDILIFTGDSVANFDFDSPLDYQFYNFAEFLYNKSFDYKHIVWIAGNHDTFLDSKYYDDSYAKKLMKMLPSNVHYLENKEINILGLKIYGTPYMPSRIETKNKDYLSNAFERYENERVKIFENIPENLDILLTHCPIDGLHKDIFSGDHLLRKRLEQMENPPKIHCFGHSHNTFGVYERNHVKDKSTLHINSAQEKFLTFQQNFVPNNITGLPIIFDVKKLK